MSGDVWLVSGLGASDRKLAWKRFASGLYQPLGVRIVEGQIYVLGRDQVTRLHDRNGDGEADFYENFNNDLIVAENFHSFNLNLETDSQGNFYFAQGAPWPPDVKSPHQGLLFQLSPDGASLRPYADGLRGPNGMAISPQDVITYTDNEGHWLPTCSLQWIRPGGFHGMKPTAHLRNDEPKTFESPLCWLPHAVDNSSGDQVWVENPEWGPLHGMMLLTSYGKASLSLVMTDRVDDAWQGAVTQFPLRFESGLIRGRANPFDGHIYVCGLSVWQSAGVQPGGFYRLRYTGKPLRMPIGWRATSQGLQVTFSEPLNREFAEDPESYQLEQWNYRWIPDYGSPHYSLKDPDQEGHDEVPIRAVSLSDDGRTVFLDTGSLSPSMQFHLRVNLRTADRARLRHDIHGTIHRVAED